MAEYGGRRSRGRSMSERIESAQEFVEEFLLYRFLHRQRRRKSLKTPIKPKRPGPQPKCTASKEELRRMYLDEGKTAKEIAAMYGMTISGVRGMLKRYGIRKERQREREKSE